MVREFIHNYKTLRVLSSFLLLGLLVPLASYAQVRKGDTHNFEDIYTEEYGINIYEPLNMVTSGDSTRNDARGYAAQGWIEDFYPDGKRLHKGYYIEGQLKAYKNYFPSGQLEREFKMMSLTKSGLNIYYEDGKARAIILYLESSQLKEEDFYKNGQLSYIEEYDNDIEYYLQRKFFKEDGQPESVLELIDKKKMFYDSKEYFENGKLKEEGKLVYNEAMGDYLKHGTWKYFDETGALKEERNFTRGEEIK